MVDAQQVTEASRMDTYTFRLRPGQDLKQQIDLFVREQRIEAGAVLTCVGSLTDFLHLSASDSTGRTIGGHLMDGCKIYTTAEMVVGVLPDVVYTREPDPAFGYKELTVKRKRRK